jgi:diguanylate cyclase (GGDEF)-like protein
MKPPSDASSRRRVLIASEGVEASRLRDLLRLALEGKWQPVTVSSFELVHQVMQQGPCDVVLVDEGLFRKEGLDGLAWLSRRIQAPLALLASDAPLQLAEGKQEEVHFWLPRALALNNPRLLTAALDRVAALGKMRLSADKTGADLSENRRQVDRLVNLLWQAAPMDAQTHWFTQHYMFERLYEEIARTGHQGAPLTVAVGELDATPASADCDGPLPDWIIERITQKKRRSDVAGQYGPKSLMLLMVQTYKAGGVTCCRRLRKILQDASPQGRPRVRVSFGLASYSVETCTPQSLLRIAEEHLEAARFGHGDGVVGE